MSNKIEYNNTHTYKTIHNIWKYKKILYMKYDAHKVHINYY